MDPVQKIIIDIGKIHIDKAKKLDLDKDGGNFEINLEEFKISEDCIRKIFENYQSNREYILNNSSLEELIYFLFRYNFDDEIECLIFENITNNVEIQGKKITKILDLFKYNLKKECINNYEIAIQNNFFDYFKFTISKEEYNSPHICSKCTKYDNLDFLKYAHQNNYTMDVSTVKLAVEYSSFSCLKYFFENADFSTFQKDWEEEIIKDSLTYGDTKILNYLNEKFNFKNYNDLYMSALKKKNFEIIHFIFEKTKNVPTEEEMKLSADLGHLETFIFLHQQAKGIITEWVAICGNKHLNILKYCSDNEAKFDERICEFCIKEGNLECLKYLHEQKLVPLVRREFELAVAYKQKECLKYLQENKCPINKFFLEFAQNIGLIS